jgi:hypothetical protein
MGYAHLCREGRQEDDVSETPDHSDHEHELVMPFITVTSKGGPHDDNAYVAGYTCGRLDALLGMYAHLGVLGHEQWFAADVAPQVDLIAMKNGYHAVVDDESDEYPGFQRAVFTLAGGDDAT